MVAVLFFFFGMDSPVGIPSHVPLVQLFYAPGQRDHNNLWLSHRLKSASQIIALKKNE